MDVLVVLRRAGHVAEVTADRVLGSLGAARGATGVHQEQRVVGGQRLGLYLLPAVVLEEIVDEVVTAVDHRALRVVLAGDPPPHEDLLDLGPLLVRLLDCLIGLLLVIDQIAVAVVGVHRDEHGALRVGHPLTASGAAEAAEHLGVDHAEPRAGEHRHRQVRDHRHVERDPVARLHSGEVTEQRGELVDAAMEFRVRDLDGFDVLGLLHPDQRVLVPAAFEVPVDAVDARVQAPADEPLEERRIARVEQRVPLLVPGEHVGVLDERLREVLLAKALEDRGIVRVGLRRERLRRLVVLLLPPMNCDLRLGDLVFGGLVLIRRGLGRVSHLRLSFQHGGNRFPHSPERRRCRRRSAAVLYTRRVLLQAASRCSFLAFVSA